MNMGNRSNVEKSGRSLLIYYYTVNNQGTVVIQ